MIVFDTLDNLELYKPIKAELQHVIDIMDRSLPYDQTPGEYKCPENDKVSYKVDAFLTGKGFEYEPVREKLTMEIILEGEGLTTLDGENVFSMAPGRFLLYSDEYKVRRGVLKTLPFSVKSVIFSF